MKKIKFKINDRVLLKFVDQSDLNLRCSPGLKGTVIDSNIIPCVKLDNKMKHCFYQNQLVKLKKKVK